MVALRGSTKIPPFQLTAYDEDLQDNPPLAGFAARSTNKEGAAKARAIVRLNTATGLNVALADFEVTRTGAGDSGPHTPVEWTYVTTAGHGNHARNWTLMVDMDDIPAGAGGAGPDRPHVGYSYWCTGYNAQNRINGHIFIEYVSASR